MHNLKACICKSNQKIFYPHSYSIELFLHNKICLLPLITDSISAGDIIVFNDVKKPNFIFKIQKYEIFQIYGECTDLEHELELSVIGLNKLEHINSYLFEIFQKLSLSDLIYNKNNLIDIEKELIKYLLNTKSLDRLDNKKLRSILFKNCKNIRLCEKLFLILKSEKFIFYDLSPKCITIDFASMSVQYKND